MAAAGSDPGRGIMAAEQEAEETVSQELHSASELRIVLLGKDRAGKSGAGNTILDRKVFRSGFGLSAKTKECEKGTGEVSGRRVTVVDTPDLLHTDRVEIERCVSLSAPGPHAFLLVIPVYSKEIIDSKYWESLVLDKVQELFGERAVKNTMILFTHGDRLRGRTIEQYIEEAGEELQQRVEKCGNRYHVLNNKNRSDRTQVTQLLDKIDNMVKGSGGCYLPISSEIYQEVEEQIRLKEQELNEKHKEELSRKEEEMKQKYEEELRREDEMKQKYEEEQRRREEEMKQKYEEEQRKREEEMKQKYEEEQRRREEEMKQKYEEELRRREEEMKQKYEEEQRKREEEMKQKYEEEQRRREEEMKQKYEEEQRRREEEMKQKYEEEQRRREEMKQKYEEEQRREDEMKQKYEEEQRRREEMKQKYEEEQRRREEELVEKLRKQMKEEELEKEAEESKLPVRRRHSIEMLPPNMSGGEGEAPTADNRAVLLGAVAGALLGAAAGALMGPWGAAAGAAIGSVAGAKVGSVIGGAARAGVAESSDTHTQRSRELK